MKAEQAKAEADAKIAADKLKAEQAKAEADAKAKADAKIAADKLKAEADAKAKADADAKLVTNKSTEDKQLDYLSQLIDDSKKNQNQSLSKLDSIAKTKENELKELKRVNDLSDKGVVTEAKEFQSTIGANRALESLKVEIAENTKTQDNFIKEFEALYNERLKKVPNKNDAVNQNYLKTIEKLKADKLNADRKNENLLAKLENIKTETDIEKKRRIKLAIADTGGAKYEKDRETLRQIKSNTKPTGKPYKSADFDFGEEQSGTQIVKNIDKEEEGFYTVLAAHKDIAKRDAFITKAIQAGETNINFFYNANNGTYYIYNDRFDIIQNASKAVEEKGNKPYNGKMFIIKIEK